MRAEDIDLKIGDKLPYNVVEDLCVFMKNNPSFYRKELYPQFVKVQDAVQNGGKFNKKSLLPLVDSACQRYVKEYDLPKRPQDLLSKEEKLECISKLLTDEMEAFRKKEY